MPKMAQTADNWETGCVMAQMRIKDIAAEAGVDAFIIADLGVLALAKKYAPQVERHVSTQAGITNYEAAKVCYELGAKRVVLARELPLTEIAQIRDNCPQDLELEAFVHGAMCMLSLIHI